MSVLFSHCSVFWFLLLVRTRHTRSDSQLSAVFFFFFSSRRRHTRSDRDWSSDVCSSDLAVPRTTPTRTGRERRRRPPDVALPRRAPARESMKAKGKRQKAKGKSEKRSEERRVGKECRSRWSPYH